MAESTTLTIRVDRSVKERLEAIAHRLNRSKSFVACEAIKEYIAVQEWQIEGINKALRSLDDGKGVPHTDVAEWVESWGTENERPKPGT
ncbi:MAG: ribbon-helix-helix protein, CopG family [Rhodospirillaceae bacterium]|jgi:RHH-type transcriptional regulator, rel operon repressor / antitoxin RelB|nr:ribbon-helix-helix protein, CopG family [Rhodospirillaceae bacterium]MBT5455498.1 ribbon-helix-helix protein, CopG family [Rhodospirillaceae bacterium]